MADVSMGTRSFILTLLYWIPSGMGSRPCVLPSRSVCVTLDLKTSGNPQHNCRKTAVGYQKEASLSYTIEY